MTVIKKFVFNPFSENTYVVWDDTSREAVIIDPGCYGAEEEQQLKKFIEERKITVKYLILTHCHIDHVIGCRFIKDTYNPSFYAPELDLPLLMNVDKQGKAFGLNIPNPPMPDKYITAETKLLLGQKEIEFLFTPGHTPGEYCVYFKSGEYVITGDVLFKGSIGRTDLWGGDYETLIDSIKQRLFTLPDNFIVYPGHGENTKIGTEKRDNPFVN